MKNLYVGILAGGSGSRLWPLSSTKKPKQLLPFINDHSLLEQAIQRVVALGVPKDHIFIITNREQEAAITQAAQAFVGSFVIEPSGRNTAPAILLGCHHIHEKDPDATVLFLPADHFIPEQHEWVKAVQQVLACAQTSDNLVLMGLKPNYPATGYGYIQTAPGFATSFAGQNLNKVLKFHEKPSLDIAQEYLTRHDMFWNIGIFAGTIKIFLQEFQHHAPAIYKSMDEYLSKKNSYDNIPNISIDYAIMEKTTRAMVIPASFAWYDVGNLYTFLSLQKLYNPQAASVINIGGNNNLVNTKKKIVACVGVSNLCIVETEDTLLIVTQDQAEKVKEVIGHVRALEL